MNISPNFSAIFTIILYILIDFSAVCPFILYHPATVYHIFRLKLMTLLDTRGATAFKILAYGGKVWYNRDMEIEKLKKAMANVEEPRRTDRGNIRHKLEDILIIGLCALLCNGNDFVDMEAFGKQREEWLKGFLALPNGIPDSDTFRRVFESLNPEALSECLYDWLGCNREEGSVIAVDGKTIRGSGNESHKAYHAVRAFVAENRMIL